MNKILNFPPTTTARPEQALAGALSFAQEGMLQDVLIVGYDAEGELYVRSSRMDRKDALWLAEQLRKYALCEV